jgi:hypothetical protein
MANFILAWLIMGAVIWSKTDPKIRAWTMEQVKALPKDATEEQADAIFRQAKWFRWGAFLLWPIALMVP